MFGAIAGGIASALAGGAMSKLFGGGQKAASGGIQGDVLATDNNTVRSEERFSRNAETDLVCRLLLEKKKEEQHHEIPAPTEPVPPHENVPVSDRLGDAIEQTLIQCNRHAQR